MPFKIAKDSQIQIKVSNRIGFSESSNKVKLQCKYSDCYTPVIVGVIFGVIGLVLIVVGVVGVVFFRKRLYSIINKIIFERNRDHIYETPNNHINQYEPIYIDL